MTEQQRDIDIFTDEGVIMFEAALQDLRSNVRGATREKVDRIIEVFAPFAEKVQSRIFLRKHQDFTDNFRGYKPLNEIHRMIITLTNVTSLHMSAQSDLDKADKATQDILHAIELLPENDPDAEQLYKDLRQIRQYRRLCKDFIELTNPLKNLSYRHDKTFLRELKEAHKEMRDKSKEFAERRYMPRVRKDLRSKFEQIGTAPRTCGKTMCGHEDCIDCYPKGEDQNVRQEDLATQAGTTAGEN